MKTNRMAMSTVAGLAALALGLAGCGGNDSGNEADEAQSSPEASESAPAGTADDQADNADDGKDDKTDDAKDSTQDASGSGLSADADLSRESPATSAEDAIKTAKKKAGNGIVHDIELDWDDDDQAWQYEVSVLDGNTDHDIEIDANSGKIVNDDQDDSDDKERNIDLNDPMTFDEALELAGEKASGKLVSWKLEYDDDKQEYQFDFDKDGEEMEATVDTDSKRVSVDD
ncbi:PepSY domain-containing protein [Brevibacterium spongiae]|uniref:PepSY domain-containing protein n=1 Tax=Brevibacterium spongiae TaxID=2909672 RepID=A0ABY5SSK0_9MICO|nr:PepSY domain-containing protein [Brevibacterium spongiae]UVI37507.1 PepSY domain-containing protein [Brevibacterium spongiae]